VKIFAKFIQDAQLLGTVHSLRDLLGGGGSRNCLQEATGGRGGLAAGHVVIFYCDFILNNIYLHGRFRGNS